MLIRLSLVALLATTAVAQAEDRPKQLVVISFDGAGNNALWQRSRDMAKRTNSHFTYFLSCSLVIDRARAKTYQAPHEKPGRSNIGFAQTKEEALTRLDHIWQARLEGHEIASHTCGHFDGKDWDVNDWRTEMRTFRSVVSSAWADLGAPEKEPQGWRDFVKDGIKGFRAPYLSTSKVLAEAERAEGFTYDGSGISKGPALPDNQKGVLFFGLPLIPEGPGQRPIVAMDYNLYIRHSAGLENPSNGAEFEARSLDAFRAAFRKQYEGNRIPLQLGFHFVEMNGGAYWRALDSFVSEVCTMPDVGCVTYVEAIARLKDHYALRPTSSL